MNELEVPQPPVESYKIPVNPNPKDNKENAGPSKAVRFQTPANIDDEEEWEHEKDIKAMRKLIDEL